jgi:ankyrin repeat protein
MYWCHVDISYIVLSHFYCIFQSGLTPLHVASFMGHMNIVVLLIQHGANTDCQTVRGETALHLAARANQTDIIRILLRNGANVDAKARVRKYCYNIIYSTITHLE